MSLPRPTQRRNPRFVSFLWAWRPRVRRIRRAAERLGKAQSYVVRDDPS